MKKILKEMNNIDINKKSRKNKKDKWWIWLTAFLNNKNMRAKSRRENKKLKYLSTANNKL